MAFSGPVFSPLKNPLQEELKDFVKVCISFISNFEVIVIIVYFSVREFVIKDWVSGVFVDLRSSFSGMNTRVRYQFLKISYDHRVFLFLFECFSKLKGRLFCISYGFGNYKTTLTVPNFDQKYFYWQKTKFSRIPEHTVSMRNPLVAFPLLVNTTPIVDTFSSSSKIH